MTMARISVWKQTVGRRVITAQLMNNRRPLSDAVRARLRKLGNPYASLQLSDEDEGAVVHPANSPKELTLELTQNPWATLYYGADDPVDVPATASPTHAKASVSVKLSKAEFRQACRAIFRCYIPEIEKGRIRDHHRNFIVRNESRSATKRFQVLEALRRYDLSSVPGFQAHFNRERDAFTDAKLREIEKQIGDDL
jgi:hypothetical protein